MYIKKNTHSSVLFVLPYFFLCIVQVVRRKLRTAWSLSMLLVKINLVGGVNWVAGGVDAQLAVNFGVRLWWDGCGV